MPVACLCLPLHEITVSQHGKMGGVNLPNCHQFNYFIETLLRFWYFCLIGPKFRVFTEKACWSMAL
jgi:hypothetical protein